MLLLDRKRWSPARGTAGAYRPRKRSAFTLIELLVVIAVIAILAAILFPVFAQAREKARQATCASNLHQLGLACMQYFQDYDEMVFPYGYAGSQNDMWSWGTYRDAAFRYDMSQGLIQPYIKNSAIMECPTARSIPLTPQSAIPLSYGINVTYMENPNYQGDPNAPYAWSGNEQPVGIAQAEAPAETLLMGDAAYMYNGMIYRSDNICPPSWQYTSLHARHNILAEILWFDGHVKAYRLVTPAPDKYPNTPAQLQAANMGTILKYPYTGNGKYDDYYFALTKFSPP